MLSLFFKIKELKHKDLFRRWAIAFLFQWLFLISVCVQGWVRTVWSPSTPFPISHSAGWWQLGGQGICSWVPDRVLLGTMLHHPSICFSVMGQQDHPASADGLVGTTIGDFVQQEMHLGWGRDGSVSQVLAAQTRGPRFNLQNPCKKLGKLVHACDLSTREVETGPCGLVASQSSWTGEHQV